MKNIWKTKHRTQRIRNIYSRLRKADDGNSRTHRIRNMLKWSTQNLTQYQKHGKHKLNWLKRHDFYNFSSSRYSCFLHFWERQRPTRAPRHGYPASFWDTSSEISNLIHLLRFVYPQISKVPHCACLHKVQSHRNTNICTMPSDSTRGKSTPPKFASRKILVKDASVCQAKAAFSIVDSDIETSPLFGDGMIIKEVASEVAA